MNCNRGIILFVSLIFSVTAISVNINDQTLQQIINSNDSVQFKELDEFIVVSQSQRTEAGGLVFLPTKRQKEIAQDGYDLLRHLAIPQISVNPTEDNVTTITGGDVMIFINGQKASYYELKSLKTGDVLRVDFLDFPSDPKFGGAQHVLNFIVKTPLSGGYTRILASSQFLNKIAAGTNVFSKFAFKRMVYDMFVGYDYYNTHHTGYSSIEKYSLVDNDSKPYEIVRQSENDYTRKHTWSLPLSFRAIYQSDKFQASNQLSFTFSETPMSLTEGFLKFSSGEVEDYTHRTSYSSINSMAGWNGVYDFNFEDGYSMSLNSNLLYIHNDSYNTYSSTIKGFDSIVTDANELVSVFDLNAAAKKQFSDKHSVLLKAMFKYYNNKIEYTGSSVSDTRQFETTSRIGVAYELNLPINLMLHIEAGTNWQKSKNSDVKHCLLTPYATLFASYAPASAHQFNLSLNYLSLILPEYMKTSTVLQSNELMFITGNPNLKPFPQFNGNFTYTWLPRNNFYLTGMIYFSEAFNSPVTVYSHLNAGNALLRSFTDDGNYMYQFYGIKLTYKPIDHLQIELGAFYKSIKDKCKSGRSINNLTSAARISYYFNKFYIVAAGSLASKNYEPMDNSIDKTPANYSFTGGWSNGAMNVKVSAENIFSGSWKSITSNTLLPLYSNNKINYDGLVHRSISLSVSYTFGYGNKIARVNEINAQEEHESAVLK